MPLSFRDYLRWDGWVLVVAGVSVCLFGVLSGDQGPAADALVSGVVLVVGTGAYMAIRHGVPFREPGGWFTAPALARPQNGAAVSSRHRLLGRTVGDVAALMGGAIGLSYLSGSWLTYMDMGVWALAIGAIKVGPGAAAVAHHEARSGATYRVARRPVRGIVELTEAGQ